MALADIPVRGLTDTRQQHLDDHNRYRNGTRQYVYSADYATVQAAIDDAVAKNRSLMFEPINYTLSAPMFFNGANKLHVSAHGATFVAGIDMPSLLDHRDCTRCSWYGGWFKVPTGRIVDNAIYVYRNAVQSTRNIFQDMTIEGDYTTGLRVGKQGSGLQCDHHWFTNMEFVGRSIAGQIGVYVGDGIYANCLNHTFNNLMCSGHETHVKVDATNASITNAFFASAETDLYINSTLFSLRNGRCENSKRLMVTTGPSSYLANINLEGIEWRGSAIAVDGEWIQHHLAGSLGLRGVQVLNEAHPSIVSVSAGAPTRVTIDGVSTQQTAVSAFRLSNATVKGDYIQHDSNGAVSSITVL